ncbi:putative glutamine amidotransferase [Bacillus thermophilus]|jgi:putative glutamine amidotransferase|uniref:Glutamine amidotransferase n=1 Tax=Siminovitchia thermophila TaxID=1245522 RepID=A0ABS2R813_9BACI|nr:gamma-glutamyl-gamma-aminobutyrate hydrolase family protein [Siminovitchia thermophila]MBM7715772.1 putative glutamine amidotransferase [Siminovitchia thermophila]ONK23568.1 hypothetical protein BLX87_10115 [Bacillus sp. VT-16-64]
MRPVIGVSAAWSNETWPKKKHEQDFIPDFYYIGRSYIHAICQLGGIPFILPPQSVHEEEGVINQIVNQLDGLLLSGGGDIGINPTDEYVPYLIEQQRHRYEFESALIKEAWLKDLPVMGICRGHQMIVEVLGGEITNQPIKNHSGKDGISDWDIVEIMPNTLLDEITENKEWKVNSYHTQAAKKLPASLNVSATNQTDDIIEAVEAHDKTFFVGVQFHPEQLISRDNNSISLFQRFIDEAKNEAMKKQSIHK